MTDPATSPATTRSPRRRRAFAVATVAGTLALGLGLAEGALRLLGRRPFVEIFAPTPDASLWVRDPSLGWRNRASFVFDNVLPGSRVATGPHGERLGLRWTEDAARPTVLFVGDSTTLCAEVGDEHTGPSEVARRLAPAPDVAVVNAGVRGYGTLQALRMTREWLARANVRLVVYTYCDNDYVENLVPIVNAPAQAPVARLRDDGSLDVVEVPSSYGPPWGIPVGNDPAPPESSPGHRLLAALEAHSTLVTELRNRLERPPVSAGIERWQGAQKWAEEHQASKVLALLLAQLREACKARSAALLVTRFATADRAHGQLGSLDTQERLVAACHEAGVSFVDLRPAFTRDEDRYVTHLANGLRDAHYGPLGTATYGEALAPHVQRALEGVQ